MRNHCIRFISLLCAAVILALLLCSCGSDPNITPDEATTPEYNVKLDDEQEDATEREGFHAYGSGKTEPVIVDGVEVSVSDFALRSYELAYMMAEKDFDNPTDIPRDLAVQYAFTHLFFRDFHSINNKAVVYRSATADQISAELIKQFGTDDFDIKSSVLYNPSKEIFEMWTPEYGTNIYYHIDAVNINGNEAEIITTFFNELKRETMLGRATITVRIQDGKPVIAALKAE